MLIAERVHIDPLQVPSVLVGGPGGGIRANELGAQVTGDVVLISDTGATVTKTNGFEYVGKGNITSVSPSAGQGTSLVTIQGSSLFGGGTKAIAVTFGGIAASIEGDNTNTSYLLVRVNAGPQDVSSPTGDVVITGDTGVEITALNAWTYSVVSSISPDSGQGGTKVTITGNSYAYHWLSTRASINWWPRCRAT